MIIAFKTNGMRSSERVPGHSNKEPNALLPQRVGSSHNLVIAIRIYKRNLCNLRGMASPIGPNFQPQLQVKH